MKYARILHALIRAAVTATMLCFPIAWAQQAPKAPQSTNSGAPVQPLPPLAKGTDSNATSGAVGGSRVQADAQPEASAQAQPDTHVLSGAETIGVGSLRRLRRMFDPALQVSEFGETGIVPGQTLSASSLGGSLDMDRHSSRYDLAVTYHGAETTYQPSSYYGIHYLPYHDAAISQEISFRRWTLQLRDDVLYSWGSGFGSLFAGGPAQAGQNRSLESIQPSLASTGTIQTALARQLSNTALGEIDYARSRRTTLTLVGSYGLLHFLDPGYINSQTVTGRVGYNYAFSAKNNVALTYDHNRITYVGTSSRLETDLAQMAFGRKVTGRLALELSAGPQLVHFAYVGSANRRQLSWSASSSLTYKWPRTGYSLSYFRGVSAGSGVFFGSSSEVITASASREFTRFWSASLHGGYAINNELVPDAFFASRFDDWFAGASLDRQIGRQLHLDLSYAFQQQTSSYGQCPVLSCGLARPFAQYGVTLQWHPLSARSASERTAR